MGKKYENWNELFCDHLCEEIEKFEECPNMEHLKKVKDLIEVVNGLQEMEMDAAIRSIAEDYGYDSSTGRFHDKHVGDMMEFMKLFNAAKGRSMGGRRRRDSRGRYMSMGPKPTIYNPPYPYPDDYPWEYPYMNDGKDKRRDSDKGRDRGGVNGSDMDDGMYMLRQKDGMPIMTPYNMAHDVPKKLTDQECEEWMEMLVGPDGSEGAHWTKPQIEAEAKRAGIDVNKYGLPLITALSNAMWADYSSVARSYNVDKPSFYIRLAEAFLNDEDFHGQGGGKEKASIYFHKIVNADE